MLQRQRQPRVDRRPAHHLRMHEVQRLRANLPDTAIRLGPLEDRRLDNRDQEIPVVGLRSIPALAPAPGELDDHSVHVGLELTFRRVADANGP